MRRLVIALLWLAVAAAGRADDAPVRLISGEVVTLFPSGVTQAASATIDVPEGVRALHVFTTLDETIGGITIEEGPIGSVGQFLDVMRLERRGGRNAHLERRDPSPGPHRLTLTARLRSRHGVAVRVEFDAEPLPPIVDLAGPGVPRSLRRFRLVVPPHEGVAELRLPAGSTAAVRVRIRRSREDVGLEVDLPTPLAGLEGGATLDVEVVRGSADELAGLELRIAHAGDAPLPSSHPAPLVPDRPAKVRLGGKGDVRADFVLHVPNPATGYSLVATATREGAGPHPDPDLFVERGRPVDRGADDADYVGIGRGETETLRLGGTSGLPVGDYFVEVTLADDELVADVSIVAVLVPEGSPAGDAPPRLPLDTWVSSSIHSERSPIDWHRVDVGEKAGSIVVQVVDATSDVDLLLADPATGAIVARSAGFEIDECLSCRPEPRRTSWLVGVANERASEDDVDFRVAVSVDHGPVLPADLRLPPIPRPTPLTETEALSIAVAEISVKDGSGSAISIDSRGYLLTCRHVLTDDDTDSITKGPILVAFPEDLRHPSRQAFRAAVVESDADLDLALVRIVGDVYGRTIPTDLHLPTIAIGDSDTLHLGDPLLVVGYPGDGSERSRTPVTASRGIVAGLEAAREKLLWIKTDAWIASGHSGGAVLDREGRLVGIAAATLGTHDAMGLARPIGLVPMAWLETIGSRKATGGK